MKRNDLQEETQCVCVMSVLCCPLILTLHLIPLFSRPATLLYRVCHGACALNMYEQPNRHL